jgi:hypothetical protein
MDLVYAPRVNSVGHREAASKHNDECSQGKNWRVWRSVGQKTAANCVNLSAKKPGRFILLALRHKVFFRSKAGTSRRVNLNDMSAICRTGACGGSKCDPGQSESACVKPVKVAC